MSQIVYFEIQNTIIANIYYIIVPPICEIPILKHLLLKIVMFFYIDFKLFLKKSSVQYWGHCRS